MACFLSSLMMLSVGYLYFMTGWCQGLVGNHDNGFDVVFAIPRLFVFPGEQRQPRVLITTASLDPVNVVLKVSGIAFESSQVITRYQHADIALPIEVLLHAGDGKQNKTIIVSASDTVSVHAMDNEYGNHDGFLALPSSNLGTQYYMASYTPQHHHQSSFCVTAVNETTQIDIETRSGQQYRILLSAYESYRFDGGDNEDLTGTYIESDNRVAVVSGIYTQVPDGVGNNDGLLEQLLPLDTWGHIFVLSPFMGRSFGYIYRVITANMPATLQISTVGTVNIAADGAFYEGDVADDSLVSIISDNPVSVVQYMKGHFTDNMGDPSMMIVPGLNLYTNNVIFPVFEPESPNPMSYHINVLIECNHVSGLTLDGQVSITNWNRLTTEDNATCSVRGIVTTGVHRVAHSDPMVKFYVCVYQHGPAQGSYLYSAGISFPQSLEGISTENPPMTDPYTTIKETEPSTSSALEVSTENPHTITDLHTTIKETESSTTLSDKYTSRPPGGRTSQPDTRPFTPIMLIVIAACGGGLSLVLLIALIIVVILYRRKSSQTVRTDHEIAMENTGYATHIEKVDKTGVVSTDKGLDCEDDMYATAN